MESANVMESLAERQGIGLIFKKLPQAKVPRPLGQDKM